MTRRLDGERGVSIIVDHPFTPTGAWYTRCRFCHLSEAAHAETTVRDEDRQP